MGLVVGMLKSNLGTIFGKFNPSPNLVGVQVANSYMQYLMMGQNAAGGPVTAVPMTGMAGSDIGNTFAKQHPVSALVAQDLTTAFGNMASSIMSVFQISIVSVPALLLPDLINIFSKQPSTSIQFSNDLADALDKWTKTFIVSGTAPGPSPFSGPLS